MRALFDVNVLIALHDGAHAFHQKAHAWWAQHALGGWASCPLTENGLVRIMSHPNYSKSRKFTPQELIKALHTFAGGTDHQFWPDDLSIRDAQVFQSAHIHSSQKLTDIYLLAIAVHRNGILVTFDRGIVTSPVTGAGQQHLCVL